MKNNPEFDKLLERYQQGKLVGEEKRLMDEWFESMGEGNIHPLRTTDDKQALKDRIFKKIRLSQHDEPIRIEERFSFRTWSIAASVVLVAVIFFFEWRYNAPIASRSLQNISVTSADGTVNKVLLADGSIVWLKNNSALTYPASFDGPTRNVVLQGEALFEVAKDAKHPFIIQCGDLITTVLGTSFMIRSTPDDVEVVVLTGKVSLSSSTPKTNDSKNDMLIVPSEKAVYSKNEKQLAKMGSDKEEVSDAVKGTEYDMHFVDTRMEEIVHRIEGKFNMTVSLENAKLGNCVVTADFTDQSLVKTLDILATVLSIEYEVNESKIKLKGNGCD
ncbi:MAG TPA: FecR domain-containing protein [Cyclobacteriaceae bacterium]|nr:FecR domain-containing protein [Cyclobacteriaceae bacterium]